MTTTLDQLLSIRKSDRTEEQKDEIERLIIERDTAKPMIAASPERCRIAELKARRTARGLSPTESVELSELTIAQQKARLSARATATTARARKIADRRKFQIGRLATDAGVEELPDDVLAGAFLCLGKATPDQLTLLSEGVAEKGMAVILDSLADRTVAPSYPLSRSGVVDLSLLRRRFASTEDALASFLDSTSASLERLRETTDLVNAACRALDTEDLEQMIAARDALAARVAARRDGQLQTGFPYHFSQKYR